MSAGMADIIAAHSPIGVDPESWDLGAQTRWRCFGCGAVESAESAPNHDVTKSIWHGTHVAEELEKAGYGLLPDVAPEYGAPLKVHGSLTADPFGHGRVRDPHWWEKSTHMRLVGPWQELEPLPDPLAAALADPEGHALAKAIHDRKAEA